MRCHEVREHLYEYLSGSLSLRGQRAIEDHLGRCTSCRKEMENLRALDTRLRREIPMLWKNVTPSPGFEARLKRSLPPSPERPSRAAADRLMTIWRDHQRALAAGIAACIILALAVSLPLTLTGGGGGQQMIAQDSSRTIPTPHYPAAESDEPALKMAAPAGPEWAATAPRPTSPPAEAANQEPALSEAYGITAGESSTGQTDEGMPFTEEMILAKERELALWIALSDSGVKEALEAKALVAVEVQGPAVLDGFECPGPTVRLTFRDTDAARTVLHICVDLDTHRVMGTSLRSESGPGQE